MKVFKHLLLVSAFWCGANSAIPQTWTQTSAPNASWTSIAVSADGTKLVAANYPGPIFTSTNSGMTWTSNNVPDALWNLASSADGIKLVAAIYGGIDGGGFFYFNEFR